MLYMVIERFEDAPAIYQRVREKGRIMPQGLEYVASWIDLDFKICWQLMRTENFALFDQWMTNWRDLMDFEIVPVRTSAEAVEVIKSKLSPSPCLPCRSPSGGGWATCRTPFAASASRAAKLLKFCG